MNVVHKSEFREHLILGVLGVLLPWISLALSVIYDGKVPPSISATYYTHGRDIFEGMLLLIGVFFLSYSTNKKRNNYLNIIMGISAIGIFLFPTALVDSIMTDRTGVFNVTFQLSNILHHVFAYTFFLALTFDILFYIPYIHLGIALPESKNRILFYKISGYIMVFIVFIFIIGLLLNFNQYFPWVWFNEMLLLDIFGTIWIVKSLHLYKTANYCILHPQYDNLIK